MENIEDNINRFLPYGEALRSVLQHESIKERERRQLLRIKGVYINKLDDDSTFPILTASLLSPKEFEFLKERLRTKEDREKTITRTMQWDSDTTLISAIPEKFNIQDIVKTSFPKYSLVGSPNFKMVGSDPNKIALDFTCQTRNYSKAWFRGKSEFRGQVTFEKITSPTGQVQLQIVHTSPETTEIAEKITKNLESHFKSKNFLKTGSGIQRIRFMDLSNDERIRFFLSMTDGSHSLTFKGATWLDIGPDPSTNLPDEIKWLEAGKVNDLNINGQILHKIPFLENAELHKFMELAEMEIIYDFSMPSVEGSCKIRFGFHNYLPKRQGHTEFVVDIVKITPKDKYSAVPEKTIRRQLLKEFEAFKAEKYLRVKSLSAPASGS